MGKARKSLETDGATAPVQEGGMEKDDAVAESEKCDNFAEICRLQDSVADLQDRLLRALADHDNYRKRMEAEWAAREAQAGESLLMELFPVMDNFTLGLRAARDQEVSRAVEGFSLIFDQLDRLLKNRGVEEVGKVGERFDPNFADAIAAVPDGTVPVDCVAQVVRTGYRLGKKLLRPALVIVSTGMPAGADLPKE
ncbi:MAG: nucleotide exchange factor GrpE [Puniceicoccales bacterium]|jgi:molecular chaperone GrpE|nr:nucleotide exchange factor GrpE [Puniceicoccales bacterium]